MRQPLLIGVCMFLTALAGWPLGESQAGAATTQLVSVSVLPDFTTQIVDFRLQFDQPPDFFTLDQFGRQQDEFQFFINNVPGPIPFQLVPSAFTGSIIRGGEIHVAGDLPIRNVAPPDASDPNAGGWGTVRGREPITLDDVVTFSAPFSTLNVTDQGFRWGLLIIHFGVSTQEEFGVVPVPLPAAAWSGLILITAILIPGLRRKFRLP
jgi:hypothetical protein